MLRWCKDTYTPPPPVWNWIIAWTQSNSQEFPTKIHLFYLLFPSRKHTKKKFASIRTVRSFYAVQKYCFFCWFDWSIKHVQKVLAQKFYPKTKRASETSGEGEHSAPGGSSLPRQRKSSAMGTSGMDPKSEPITPSGNLIVVGSVSFKILY